MSAVSLRVRKMLAASINVFAMLTSMPVPKIPGVAATSAGADGGAPRSRRRRRDRRREHAPRRRRRQPWRRGRLGRRLRRLQIVELLLKAADLRLVLFLNFSDLFLQLFDRVVRGCLRRGRHPAKRSILSLRSGRRTPPYGRYFASRSFAPPR